MAVRIDSDTENSVSQINHVVFDDGTVAAVWTQNVGGTSNVFYTKINDPLEVSSAPVQITQLAGSPGATGTQLEILSDDNLLITWSEMEGGVRKIVAQKYDTDGNELSGKIVFGNSKSNTQDSIEFSDGNILTVYRESSSETVSWDVSGQLLDLENSTIGSSWRVNETLSGDQLDPNIVKLVTDSGSDKFVVIHSSSTGDEDAYGIRAKIFEYSNAALTDITPEFTVNTTTSGWQRNGANEQLVATSDGGFAIAFTSANSSGSSSKNKVLLQKFDSLGQKVFSEITIFDNGSDFTTLTSITELNNGEIAVMFSVSPADRSDHDTYVQVVNANGEKIGHTFKIHEDNVLDQGHDANGSYGSGSIAAHGAGGFVASFWGELSSGERGAFISVFSESDIKTAAGYPTISTTTSLTTDEDTATGAIAFSGSDVDGDELTFTFSDPSKGTVTNNDDGTFTYTPNANVNGSDSFTITVNDGTVDVTETVNVAIAAVNDAPTISTTTSLSTDEDTAIAAIAFSGSDVDGDSLTFSFSDPAKGTVTNNDDGTFIYTPDANANGSDSFTITANDGTVDVTETVNVAIAPVNDLPTGAVTITGTATEEQVLTAVTITLEDEDGLGTLSYQWKADGANITGATASTLNLGQSEVGKAITVSVSYTDGESTTESVTSEATSAVENVNDAPSGEVAITGTTSLNHVLKADTAALIDEDGFGSLKYQWLLGGTEILGATASTYTLAETDVGSTVAVRVMYTDGGKTEENVTSAATLAVTHLTTYEDDPIPFTLNDVGALDAVSYNFGQPEKGVITNNNGNYTYTPFRSENGNDSFTISYTNGLVEATKTMQIKILPVNDDVFFVDYINRIENTEEITIHQSGINTIEIPKLTFNFENLNIGLSGDRTFESPGLIFETNKLSEDFDGPIISSIQLKLIEDLGVAGTLSNLREGDEREITLSFDAETYSTSDGFINTDNSTDLSLSYTTNRLSSKLNLENREHDTFNYFEYVDGNNYYEIKIFDVINSFGETLRPLLPLYQNATYYYELDGIPLISNDLDTASIITGQFDII